MARHPRRQILGQGQQLGTGVGVELLPRDIVGQQRIVVDRARALTVVGRTPGLVRTPLRTLATPGPVVPRRPPATRLAIGTLAPVATGPIVPGPPRAAGAGLAVLTRAPRTTRTRTALARSRTAALVRAAGTGSWAAVTRRSVPALTGTAARPVLTGSSLTRCGVTVLTGTLVTATVLARSPVAALTVLTGTLVTATVLARCPVAALTVLPWSAGPTGTAPRTFATGRRVPALAWTSGTSSLRTIVTILTRTAGPAVAVLSRTLVAAFARSRATALVRATGTAGWAAGARRAVPPLTSTTGTASLALTVLRRPAGPFRTLPAGPLLTLALEATSTGAFGTIPPRALETALTAAAPAGRTTGARTFAVTAVVGSGAAFPPVATAFAGLGGAIVTP
ncbi:MAG: hypothetical protein JWL58_6806 [Streptosporangiaceae bacterium]|nr:hypothetical protein [Streptosporangiaceae bacterium]